jgi:hypothetical protein
LCKTNNGKWAGCEGKAKMTVEKDKKVLRPFLGANIQATAFGGGC